MADMLGSIFIFILPIALFLIGILLILRGNSQKSIFEKVRNAASGTTGELVLVRGKVGSDRPAKGFVTDQPCIYSKLVLDYLDPKKNSWCTGFSTQRATPFYIQTSNGRIDVDLSGSQIDIKRSHVYQEEKKQKASLLGRPSASRITMSANTDNEDPYGTEFDAEKFDKKAAETLAEVSKTHRQILNYMNYRKKLQIYNIEVGDEVTVLGHMGQQGTRIQKGSDGIFLISDQKDVAKQFQGRYILTTAAGGALCLVSILLFLFLL
jgi:hypothetical protein